MLKSDPAPPPPARQAAIRHEVPSAAHQALGLWVHGCGRDSHRPPSVRCVDRVFGLYAAVFIPRGRGSFESAPTGRLPVVDNTFFWVFPEIAHTYGPDPSWAERWVSFQGPVADAYRRQRFLTPERALFQVADGVAVLELFSRIEAAFATGGPLAAPLAAARVHELIVTAYGLQTGLTAAAAGAAGAPADDVVAAALAHIERQALLGLTPEQLAADLQVGYSTLRRRFKAQTGYAVKEYMLRIQLRHAKELLTATRLSIGRIAEQAGFVDPYYFSRLFHSREGVSPARFRRQQHPDG